MLDPQPCMNVGARRQPQPPCFPQHQPVPWKWLQDPPLPLPASRTGWPRQGRCTASMLTPRPSGLASLAHIPAGSLPCLSSSGVCASLRELTPLSASPRLPKSGRRKGGPDCPRQAAVPHTGRSPFLPAPWRSSLIQSQHNGAEMAPLILLGRWSRCMVGISNGFLPRGTGSQDSAPLYSPVVETVFLPPHH